MNTPRRVFGYTRISTSKQSLENQTYAILNYCKARGLPMPEEIVEGTASGARSWRKRDLGVLIAKMEPGQILVTSELSRIGRQKGSDE